MDRDHFASACTGGHLEVMKWLRSEGCPWDEGTCSMAAMGIGDEILKWLRSQDPPCPWDYSTPDAAAFSGNVFALEYAVENGCDFDPDACMDEAEEMMTAQRVTSG